MKNAIKTLGGTSCKIKSSQRKAFTLAEVLVTLVIIGVVAALTIPVVIHKYNKIQTVTRLKKVYTTMSNAYKLAEFNNGSSMNWITGEDFSAVREYINQYLTPYLKIEKICFEDDDSCDYLIQYPNGAPLTLNYAKKAKFFLNDGSFFMVYTSKHSAHDYLCTGNMQLQSSMKLPNAYLQALYGGCDYNGQYYYNVATFVIDINGKAKPNILGKDVFFFKYDNTSVAYESSGQEGPAIPLPDNGKFVPQNEYSSREEAIQGCKTAGICCAALIIGDGWKISDDYPLKI